MTRFLPYLFSLMLLFVTACGSGSDQQETDNATADTQTTEQAGGIRTIEIIGTDNMKFVVEGEQAGITTSSASGEYLLLETISAEPGEEIRIRLTTESQMPPSAMSHNFVLLTMNADATAFASAAAKAKNNDYIPADMNDQVLANTELAGGGETVEVTFSAPEETGDYEYICSFPGHFSAGMKGVLSVE